jgi:hypothetical protein
LMSVLRRQVLAYQPRVDLLYLLDQFGILFLAPTRLCLVPAIIPTTGNPQRLTTFLHLKIHR